MVNEEKIKLMTKLATYEQGEGKEALQIMQYFQSDYIIFHVMRTWISATVSYVGILAIICLVKGQYLMENIHRMKIEQLVGGIIIGYILMLAVYLTAALVVYMRRYDRAKQSVKRYYHWLKQLNLFYKK
ncbi:MAG: hypothetical protein K2M46_06240 [Lachnospiraceae bacterium]|nr:hypothetical protein [Lachnospiraceae bacterium]